MLFTSLVFLFTYQARLTHPIPLSEEDFRTLGFEFELLLGDFLREWKFLTETNDEVDIGEVIPKRKFLEEKQNQKEDVCKKNPENVFIPQDNIPPSPDDEDRGLDASRNRDKNEGMNTFDIVNGTNVMNKTHLLDQKENLDTHFTLNKKSKTDSSGEDPFEDHDIPYKTGPQNDLPEPEAPRAKTQKPTPGTKTQKPTTTSTSREEEVLRGFLDLDQGGEFEWSSTTNQRTDSEAHLTPPPRRPRASGFPVIYMPGRKKKRKCSQVQGILGGFNTFNYLTFVNGIITLILNVNNNLNNNNNNNNLNNNNDISNNNINSNSNTQNANQVVIFPPGRKKKRSVADAILEAIQTPSTSSPSSSSSSLKPPPSSSPLTVFTERGHRTSPEDLEASAEGLAVLRGPDGTKFAELPKRISDADPKTSSRVTTVPNNVEASPEDLKTGNLYPEGSVTRSGDGADDEVVSRGLRGMPGLRQLRDTSVTLLELTSDWLQDSLGLRGRCAWVQRCRLLRNLRRRRGFSADIASAIWTIFQAMMPNLDKNPECEAYRQLCEVFCILGSDTCDYISWSSLHPANE
ncbi:uncharacterized protein LOC143040852 [Oratosquilla oratoria]|uniref:uncharacterized protein LOC143040852 n=1 Tax=Oratosquilla oratoria TaxID=337810 RepID=UPI003F7744C9